MTVEVRYKFSPTPNGNAGGSYTERLDTTDTSYFALKAMIEAKYPNRYNIGIIGMRVIG